MNKFLRKTKGAISIFLIIALLPTMSFVGLFVDLARVELSKEVATSSAELVLNTVLSQYDKMLKENYGLFASGQNVDPKVYEDYFKACLVSAGVSTDDASSYVSNIMELFTGEEGIADFLRMSESGFSIQPAQNGTLTNPAIIKSQIVEFMKYRAPINAVADLFKDLNDDTVKDEMENLSPETDLIEKRKAFYSAENDLMQQGKLAYEAIVVYESKAMATEQALTNLSNAYKTLAGNGSSLEQVVRDNHEIMVKDLYTTHDANGNLKGLLRVRPITNPGTKTTYSDTKKAKKDQIKTALNNLSDAIENYEKANSSMRSAWGNFKIYNSSTDYGVQYWSKLTEKMSSSYNWYVNATNNVWNRYEEALNAVTYCEDGAMDTKMKFSNQYISSLNGKDELTYQEIYDALKGKYTEEYNSFFPNGNSTKKSVDSSIWGVATTGNEDKMRIDRVNQMYNIRNQLAEYKKNLDATKSAADNAKTQVAALSDLIDKYKTAFEAWKKIANDSRLDDCETATGPSGDRALVAEAEKSKLMNQINKESVAVLEKRLSNISRLMNTLSTAITNIKYNGTPLVNISNYSAFRTAAKLDASKITINNNSLNQYVNDSFNMEDNSGLASIEFDTSQDEKLEVYGTTASGQDYLRGYRISLACTPELSKTNEYLYQWLKKEFGNGPGYVPPNDYVNSDEDANTWKDKTNNKKGDEGGKADTSGTASASKNEIRDAATLPSGGAENKFNLGEQLKNISSFIGGLFKDFGSTFGGAAVNARDHLFTIDYIMSMFTYDTFDEEGKFSCLDEAAQNEAIKSRKNDSFTNVTTIVDKWKASDDKKSLTMKVRNKDNQYSYLNEVEYILYGSSNKENKNGTYGRIYLIRYALDTGPVFKAYYDNGVVEAIAKAVQAFLHIPAPLTKTLICMGITAAEAGMDLSVIKKGIPLLLFKSETKDLICSFNSVFNGGENSNANSGDLSDKRIRLQYSDYLCIFLFQQLSIGNEEGIYLRTADAIQANMRHIKKQDVKSKDSFSMSKCVAYYQLKTTITVEPFLSQILLFGEAGDELTNKGWRTYTIDITRGY